MTRRTSRRSSQRRRSSRRIRRNSSQALKWYSPGVGIWVTRPVDVPVTRYGRLFDIEVVFRADGRSGDRWRTDLANYTTLIWEAIDGGRDDAPHSLAQAKKLAGAYFRAAIAQGTLHPKGL